ncbi:RhtX/FptX family siderophore transporter [Archangium gephyra]|uniref:AmpG permease n=1 Tax=Archangium gephyra TaxID=48 RepID=A0AAC8Q6Q3_9BACT|nr:MFS transporter [Archangium gephyra]AKJ01889.1 AmpG permease [Archangium gephyra]REG34698.1 RhtX/FptX family siderophore transporter [Archangium gephyra]
MKTSLNTPMKLGLLTSLYLSQGLPFGFFTQTLPVLLRKQGMSLPDIGLANLLALPWALKFLWAPLMDRYGSERLGRRRGYILPLQFLSAALLLGLALPEGTVSIPALLGAVLLVNLLAATQDVATDGLAVELLERHERGWGNGIQVAGYRVGMILGGGLMLILIDTLGWRATLLSMGGMLLVATVPVALFREPPSPASAHESVRLGPWLRESLLSWARRPGAGTWLTLLALFKAGEHLATGMLRTFLVDTGLELAQVGWMLGVVGFTTGLLGALIGGALVNRLGQRRALLVFGTLQAAAVLLYALAARGASLPVLALVCGVEHLASGMATAALFTVMMDQCRPEHAASDYTLQASLVVLATGAAAAVSGFSAQAFGYAWHFTLSAAVCALAVVWVALTFHPPRTLASGAHPEVS